MGVTIKGLGWTYECTISHMAHERRHNMLCIPQGIVQLLITLN